MDRGASPPPAYPPAPWRLRGEAVLRLQRLPVEAAAAFLPPGLRPLRVSPGRTLGGLYAARYGAGSSLQYHELIVFPALVRLGPRVGAWISHTYVDDAASLAGGREIWGLDKQAARFQWDEGQGGREIIVSLDQTFLCDLRVADSGPALPFPVLAPAWSRREESFLAFSAAGRARVRAGRMELCVPASSPFAALGLHGGGGWTLGDMKLAIGAGRERAIMHG